MPVTLIVRVLFVVVFCVSVVTLMLSPFSKNCTKLPFSALNQVMLSSRGRAVVVASHTNEVVSPIDIPLP